MSTESKKTFKLRNELLKREGVQTYNPNTKLYYVSASQISDFRRCKKRWYHKVVDKVKEPDKASAALGSAVHAFIERAIIGEFPEDFPENVRAIALSGQRFWPRPETEMDIEREFVLEDPDVPMPMYGFIDVRTPDEVIDHKTTSNIAQYGKVAEQWQNDPQGIIYPAANLSLGGKPRFRIIYYQTRGRASSEVVVDMTPGQIRFGLQEIGRDVKEMLRLSQLPLTEVPHNEQACGDYGGCYMRNLCARVGVVPSNVGAYAEVWAALYQTPDQTQQPVAVAPTGEKEKEKEMSMSEALSYRERMLAQRAAAASKAAQLTDPEAEEGAAPVVASASAATPLPTVVETPTINPPDGVAKSPATEEELKQVMATVAPVTPASSSDEDEDDTPPVPTSRGRGRPAGAKNKPAAAVTSAIIETPTAPVETPVAVVAPEVSTAGAVAVAEKAVVELEAELASAKSAEADADKKAKTLRALAMEGDDEALEKLPAAKKKAADAVAIIEAIGSRLSDAKKNLAKVVAEESKRREEAKRAAEAEAAAKIVNSVVYAASPEPAQIMFPPGEMPKLVFTEGTRAPRTMYLGCSPEKDTAGIVHFDDWVQQFARRAESARQTPYYRMLPHNAVDAVVAEILADLRSGAQQPPTKLVFRRFSAQYFQYAQDLRPFYDEVIS